MSSASFVYGGYPTPRPPPLPDEAGGEDSGLEFVDYQSEAELPEIVHLIEKELRSVYPSQRRALVFASDSTHFASEPYLIYNYRYFLEKWYVLMSFGTDETKQALTRFNLIPGRNSVNWCVPYTSTSPDSLTRVLMIGLCMSKDRERCLTASRRGDCRRGEQDGTTLKRRS